MVDDYNDDSAITQRLRILESFMNLTEHRVKRVEEETKDDRKQIFEKLGHLDMAGQTNNMQLLDKVDQRISGVMNAFRSEMSEMHLENKDNRKIDVEQILALGKALQDLQKKLAFATGIVVAAQFAIPYVIKLIGK